MPTQTEIAHAAAIMREATRDKTYQLFPMGQEAAGYLRVKRKRLSEASYRDYERGLDKLARYFPDLDLADFEPPVGTQRIEEFLDAQYGAGAPGSYNKNLSILRDFFKFQVIRSRLHGDPTLAVERARKAQTYRTTYSEDECHALLACAEDRRDRLALRLLMHYGLRKGALRAVQFKHFDHQRRQLTIFTKGSKVRQLPIPEPDFWMDLERYLLDASAAPSDYLMCWVKPIPNAGVRRFGDRQLSDTATHMWFKQRLRDAGIDPEGRKMHSMRHTAGQRVLDRTGNLKAVQKLLGHASISTTGDIYSDWDIDKLTQTMAEVLND